MIHQFLQEKLPEIKNILHKHHVTSAYAFGSVCTNDFNENSDVDLLITIDETIEPLERGELWWELYYSLKKYLNREVDLVNQTSLSNPYFIKELNQTRQHIYG